MTKSVFDLTLQGSSHSKILRPRNPITRDYGDHARLRRSFWLWQISLALLFLTGCVAGPNYRRPSVPAPPAWKEQPPWREAAPKDSLPKGEWWKIFGDTVLNQYETQAVTANATMEAARLQLEQARATVRITQSGLLPQFAGSFLAQR